VPSLDTADTTRRSVHYRRKPRYRSTRPTHDGELAALIDVIRDRVTDLRWAIDLADGAAALMFALLLHRDQPVFHLPGIAVNRASAGYRAEGRTDAKDAAIIADQARIRRDLRQLQLLDDDTERLLTATAPIWTPNGPAASTGPRPPRRHLSCPGTSSGLHQSGPADLDWRLPEPHRNPPAGPGSAGLLVGEAPSPRRWAACRSRRPRGRPANSGDPRRSSSRLRHCSTRPNHPRARPTTRRHRPSWPLWAARWPGLPLPTTSPATQASHPRRTTPATAPATCTGPQRFNRQLERVLYTSAMISIQRSPASNSYYDGKRAQGKRHTQAVLALARRRVNGLWARLRDDRPRQEQPPSHVLAA
jgi:Transposase